MNFINEIEAYFDELKDILQKLDRNSINFIINKLIEVYAKGGMIYIFGNGGSASTASHFVNDFNKGVSGNLSKRFKFICLNDNVSTMMAVANDISYDSIFKFQLENYLTPRDLVFGISGSGNSENVVQAIEYANSVGADTVALLGFNGGKLKESTKHHILVPVNDMQKVEDIHMILDHLMMKIIKEFLERCNTSQDEAAAYKECSCEMPVSTTPQ
ncbi:MAG: SIS domain-containing protein [Clostridia bacterium]|nr:SIS domain-containing protein [Clostridia bacterium]